MSDEVFLAYVEGHSRTPRALFSHEHTSRLHALAGVTYSGRGWVSIHSDYAQPLVDAARARLATGAVS